MISSRVLVSFCVLIILHLLTDRFGQSRRDQNQKELDIQPRFTMDERAIYYTTFRFNSAIRLCHFVYVTAPFTSLVRDGKNRIYTKMATYTSEKNDTYYKVTYYN